MDKLSSFIVISYSVLLFVGGLIGFLKAHSQASLITGTISALIVVVAWQLSIKRPKGAHLFIASLSLILSMFFLRRFVISQNFMPGGLMLILSTITLVASSRGYMICRKAALDAGKPEHHEDDIDNEVSEEVKVEQA